MALPQPLADEVQRHAEEQDKHLTIGDDIDQQDNEELAQTLEDGNSFPSSRGGGVLKMKKTNLIKNLTVQKTTMDRQKLQQELVVSHMKQICVVNHHKQNGKRSFLN